MNLEKLAEQIQLDMKKEGEPITYEEALEMAEMEIKAKGIKRYEQTETKKERKPRERKVDEEKKEILSYIEEKFNDIIGLEVTEVKTETEIHFTFNNNKYSVKLTKHRPKK